VLAFLAILLLLVVETLAGEHRFVSPNGQFEAYTIAAKEDGTGMKFMCVAQTRVTQAYS
jgi:hypothetical protein